MNKNKLYFGDNLDILKSLYKENPKGFIDLIYIDPPFNSKRNYNVLFESVEMTDTKAQKEAFADTWSNISYKDTLDEILELNKDIYDFLKALDRISNHKASISYLTTMTIRLIYMHKLLKDTGSFYLHCDPTMSHYLKIICDLIFGEKNFQNEIIWCYKTGGATNRRFGRKHDIIFFYSKSAKYIFNPQKEKSYMMHEYGFKKSDFQKDEKGQYSWVIAKDWWEIPSIGSATKERLGYDTQKPELLLEKIIKASSNDGDLIVDFFCGCGTTIAVAEKLNRNWIGVDISHLAIRLIINRLTHTFENNIEKKQKLLDNIEVNGLPKDIDSAKELAEKTSSGRLKFEEWIVEFMLHGILNENRTQMGFDGYFTFDVNGEKQIGMIEVKSGNTNPTQLNHFIKTVESKNGSIGVFVCFDDKVTRNMRIIEKDAGYYNESIWGHNYPRIQILTVEGLLKGDKIKVPVSTKTTFRVSEPEEIYITKQNKLEL